MFIKSEAEPTHINIVYALLCFCNKLILIKGKLSLKNTNGITEMSEFWSVLISGIIHLGHQ